jgi:hypothetical protein
MNRNPYNRVTIGKRVSSLKLSKQELLLTVFFLKQSDAPPAPAPGSRMSMPPGSMSRQRSASEVPKPTWSQPPPTFGINRNPSTGSNPVTPVRSGSTSNSGYNGTTAANTKDETSMNDAKDKTVSEATSEQNNTHATDNTSAVLDSALQVLEAISQIAEASESKQEEEIQHSASEVKATPHLTPSPSVEDEDLAALLARPGNPVEISWTYTYDIFTKVKIAGDFTNWKLINMKRDGSQVYKITVNLEPGVYVYRFNVGGVWKHDVKQPSGFSASGDMCNKIVIN